MWQAIGASVEGKSHLRSGSPCQDAHGYCLLDGGVVAAIADGLGSSTQSHEGAQLAVSAALESLVKCLRSNVPDNIEDWRAILLAAFSEARRQVTHTSERSGVPLREYGTTLVVVVATNEWLAVGHVGDGAVVAHFSDGTLESFRAPKVNEFVNETIALTADGAFDLALFTARQARIKSLAMFTDGLQDLCLNSATGKPFSPFFAPLFAALNEPLDTANMQPNLTEFLRSDRVRARTDDDTTLLVIGHVPVDGALPIDRKRSHLG